MPSYEQLLSKIINPRKSVIFPLQFLHPTQSPVHLCEKKATDVKNGLQTEGENFLFAHPIIASFLSLKKGVKPIILDGHHRVNESFVWGIHMIPTQLFTLEQVARETDQDLRVLRWEFSVSAEQADEFSAMENITGGAKYWSPEIIPGIQTEEEFFAWTSLVLLHIS